MVRRGITIQSKNCYGDDVAALQARTAKEKSHLMSLDEVRAYNVMYGCQWAKFKKENKQLLLDFWEKSGLDPKRPLIRLVPRAAIRGGLTDVYRLTCDGSLDRPMHFYDMNGMYSKVARDMQFPIGEYEVALERDLQLHLKIIDNKFYYKNSDCSCDIAMVSVLAPSNLMKPFLPYRFGEQNFYGLCFSCIKSKNCGPCRHRNVNKRRFTSTYTVIELEFALTLGYQILYIYELYHYARKEPLLRDFVTAVYVNKLKSSDLLSSVPKHQHQNLCEHLNAKMGTKSSPLEITPHNIRPNPSQQQFFKDILNGLFGRFAINTNYSKRVFLRSQNELDALMADKEIEILDFFAVGETLEVEYIKNASVNPNKQANLFFTALINAQARIILYQVIQKLENDHCEVLYVDTDSILFSSPCNYLLPFDVSNALGDFKAVLGPEAILKKFFCLGPRNYCILYEENAELKYMTKIKGLSVNSHNVKKTVSPETYQKFISAHFEDRVINEYIPQCRAKVDLQTKSFKHVMVAQKFSNELHLKRFILKKMTSKVTFPYGYSFHDIGKIQD